jgi:hypothetical protein
MQEVLMGKLLKYLLDNSPEVLIALQREGRVIAYLFDKIDSLAPVLEEFSTANTPSYTVEESCMDELTKDLRPSRFNYLTSVLDEEFETDYSRFEESGILTYEVINLIEVCKPLFEALGFTVENEDDKHLRYAITGAVKEYLENKQ